MKYFKEEKQELARMLQEDVKAKYDAITAHPEKPVCSCGMAFKDENITFSNGVHFCHRILMDNNGDVSVNWYKRK